MAKKRKSGKKNRRKTSRKQTAAPAPISLCMIVKDEQRYLEGCLQSVAGLVSEIIIVDTGSQDKTIEIARRFTDKIYHFEWCDDFAAARNFGLQFAVQPWILYLDADERLHSNYHDVIRRAVLRANADAYYLRVCSEVSSVLGDVPHIMAYPRLFRNQAGVEFEGRIHEQITPAIRRMGGRFAPLDVEIEHLGYHISESELKEKISRNLTALLQQVEDEPHNAYAKFQLGQTYILSGQPEKGETYLKEALESKTLSNALNASVLLIFANERFKQEQYPEAIVFIREALQLAPRQRLGWFLLSDCFGRLEKYPEAIECLDTYQKFKHLKFTDLAIDKFFADYLIDQRLALYHFFLKKYETAIPHFRNYWVNSNRYKSSSLERFIYALLETSAAPGQYPKELERIIEGLDQFDYPDQAINMLATYLQEQSEWKWLARLFRRAVEWQPAKAEYHFLLGNNFLSLGDWAAAEQAFSEALKRSDSTFEIYHNLAITAIKQGDYAKAIHWYREILERFPGQTELAVKRISALYLKLGRVEEAQKFLSQMIEQHTVLG